MNGNFPEENNMLLGSLSASAAGPLAGDIVNAACCNDLTVVFMIEAGADGTPANDNTTVSVKTNDDNAGTNATAFAFDEYYILTGDSTLAGAGGQWTRVSLDTAVTSYTTVVASAAKQIQIAIPIRGRKLPAGQTWISGHASATAARKVAIWYIRHNNDNQPLAGVTLH